MALDRDKKRSEERVQGKLGICSTDHNTSERGRVKDVGAFRRKLEHDILRTFINETSKFEHRIGRSEMRKRCSQSKS